MKISKTAQQRMMTTGFKPAIPNEMRHFKNAIAGLKLVINVFTALDGFRKDFDMDTRETTIEKNKQLLDAKSAVLRDRVGAHIQDMNADELQFFDGQVSQWQHDFSQACGQGIELPAEFQKMDEAIDKRAKALTVERATIQDGVDTEVARHRRQAQATAQGQRELVTSLESLNVGLQSRAAAQHYRGAQEITTAVDADATTLESQRSAQAESQAQEEIVIRSSRRGSRSLPRLRAPTSIVPPPMSVVIEELHDDASPGDA